MKRDNRYFEKILAFIAILPAGCSMDFSSLGSTTPDAPPDVQEDPPPNDDGGDPPAPDPDPVPTNPYCDAVADWDEAWAAFEEEVVEL
ncbi:MAG TPA: hypothetical protein VLN73_03610, partial [Alphaproteobacteria bacterium]|nr:hypothetical protein [Alphaproteobacteria bacterium]